ncbi:MAG: S-layer homology domain-containing protein [Clostridia bacterium]|nr:S-layer homology domain-containing protein [Clostridia bacterium]
MIFCIQVNPVVMAAEPDTGDMYTESINLVKDLGILTLGEYDPDYVVQRRDLAEAAAKCMQINAPENEQKVFADVSEDDKSAYIYAAYSMGIMNGYFDGTFQPFKAITYNEAVKTLVTMAGYAEYAECKGGWPYGYHIAANSLKINQGIQVSGDDIITLGEFCLMLVETLEIDMMDTVSVKGDSISYETVKGKTILSTYWDIDVIYGRLTENYLTSLTAESTLDTDEVMIDEKVYNTSSDSLYKEIGKYLVCYVRNVSGRDTIIAYREQDVKSSELCLTGDDVNEIAYDEISYFNASGSKKTARLYEGADLIYNGAAKVSWAPADITSADYIRLLDTDGNGYYDIIFADDYVNLIVKSYIELDETIYFKTSLSEYAGIDLSADSGLRYELTDIDGNAVDPAELKEDTIISTARSNDGKVYIMKVSTDKLSGTCTSVSDDEITIDDTAYTIDLSINDDPLNRGIIEFGKSGTYYFDALGKVAAVTYTGGTVRNYAYLVGINQTSGLSGSLQVKIFAQDSKFYVYDVANKLKLNEASATSSDILSNRKLVSAGKVVPQLITFELDSEGKIRSLSYAQNGSGYSTDEERQSVFTLDDQYSSVICRKGNMNMLASRYFIKSDTPFFVIPEDISLEEKFFVIQLNRLQTDDTYRNVKLYDIDVNHKIGAAVIKYEDSIFVQDNRLIGVVLKTSSVLDSEGDNASKIYIHRGGRTEEMITVDEDLHVVIDSSAIVDLSLTDYKTQLGVNYILPHEIKTGDIIEYSRDSNSKISTVNLMYRQGTQSLKESSLLTITKDNVYSMRTCSFVEIDKLLDGGIRVLVPSTDGLEMWMRAYPILSSTLIMRYNHERNVMEKISKESIQSGDKAFIYAQSSTVKLIIIY